MLLEDYRNRIFSIQTEDEFNELALWAFHYQACYNNIYADFLKHLKIKHDSVNRIEDIPFLPVSLFKTQRIISGIEAPKLIFETSGTTGENTGKHFVIHPDFYIQSCIKAFSLSFGNPKQFCFLALLPSYLERNNSSLIYMIHHFIENSVYSNSGFYLKSDEVLIKELEYTIQHQIPTVLFGVSFALLDFAEQHPMNLSTVKIIETGGMKGRREEITRTELHTRLIQAFHVSKVYSEYGMTELLSQAYTIKDEEFQSPPWMKILIRETDDPLTWSKENKTGGISIIDLANIDSCCFIATQDLGKKTSPNTFQVLGRYDNSDIRGCNLMVS